jgi:hypothetical protein
MPGDDRVQTSGRLRSDHAPLGKSIQTKRSDFAGLADVSADGGKFLLPVVQEPTTSHLVVMLGWESLLKRTGTDSARR